MRALLAFDKFKDSLTARDSQTAVPYAFDLSRVANDPLRKEKSSRKLTIIPRRPHRDRYGLMFQTTVNRDAQPDLQRLLDRQLIDEILFYFGDTTDLSLNYGRLGMHELILANGRIYHRGTEAQSKNENTDERR